VPSGPSMSLRFTQAQPQSARRNGECSTGRRACEFDLPKRGVAKRSQTRSHSRVRSNGLPGTPTEQRWSEPSKNQNEIAQPSHKRRSADKQRDRYGEADRKQEVIAAGGSGDRHHIIEAHDDVRDSNHHDRTPKLRGGFEVAPIGLFGDEKLRRNIQ